MPYPTKEIGQLIKKHRLDQNMSQESLCKGICAVSYLSKIESGLVLASEEIISQLFAALGLIYETDPLFLKEGSMLMDAFFKASFYNYTQEVNRLYEKLACHESRYLVSPLMLNYMLVKAYATYQQAPESCLPLCEELAVYISSFTSTQQHYYMLLQGSLELFIKRDYDYAIQLFTAANAIRTTTVGQALIAQSYYFKGAYPLSIDLNEEAFNTAIHEGNLYWAIEICINQACAYSNLKHVYLMLKYYKRALNLCEGLGDIHYKEHIYYNLGATYLTVKEYDEALSYCLQSLALANLNHTPTAHRLQLYHKLALIYQTLHNTEEAKAYLDLAFEALQEIPDENIGTLPDCLEVVRLRLEDPHYLTNPTYVRLLESIYHSIGDQLHHGFKLFHGDYLIEAYKATRRYKDALRITEELYVHQQHFLEYTF